MTFDALPLTDEAAIHTSLERFLNGLPEPPLLLGLGEPTHGVEAFSELRNDLFRVLVQRHGFRAIALESDCLSAPLADAYVHGSDVSLAEVMERGFSHGFGKSAVGPGQKRAGAIESLAAGAMESPVAGAIESPVVGAMESLVTWLRAHNAGVEPDRRVRLYGFDAPLEMDHAPSPRVPLLTLFDLLDESGCAPAELVSRAEIEELLGAEAAWADQAALFDGAASIGRTGAARALRIIADDLTALLDREVPAIVRGGGLETLRTARMHARTAVGLLRYHDRMASTEADRVAVMLGVRDAMMADNLLDIVATERRRGPVLAFAHNMHLRRQRSAWTLAGTDLRWWSAGALVSPILGSRYAFVASDSARTGDAPGTLQQRLAAVTPGRALFSRDTLAKARDLPPAAGDSGYFPVKPRHLDQMDGLAFLTPRRRPN